MATAESAEPRNNQTYDADAVQTKRAPTETHVQSSQIQYSSQPSNINLTKKFEDGKSMSSLDHSEKRWQHQKPAQKDEGDPYIKISFCQKKVRNQKAISSRKRSKGTYIQPIQTTSPT